MLLALLGQGLAQLEQARKQLDDTELTAPFSGRIEQRMVQQGELVSPGSPIVRVVNTATVRVTSGVPERFAADIRPGTNVSVHFRAYGSESHTGRVSFVGNVIDASSRTFPIEVEVDNPDLLFKPEMTVELLVTRSFHENVITVPRTALIRDETGLNVFIVNRDEERPVAEFRAVETGRSSGGQVLILEGLYVGEEVVVAGQGNLSHGDQVSMNHPFVHLKVYQREEDDNRAGTS
jgi:membrane fusion protein, multidrug efflux system